MKTTVRETAIGGDLGDFLDVARRIYAGDPSYVCPIDLDLKRRISAANPFFDDAQGVVLTAYDGQHCVGRCTAQIDRAHLARHADGAGFFGFFDTIDDRDVARALLAHAAGWLRARGMRVMRGPISLNLNEEAGCLVDGFEQAHMMMMPHHRPYQASLIEAAGLSKAKDLLAWRYELGEIPKRVKAAHDAVLDMPEVVTRHVNVRKLAQDVQVVTQIINDAWHENWGFVPMSPAQLAKMSNDLKLLIVPELTFISEIAGEPAAVALALPNLNEAIADLDGKLFPFGLPKLLWRLKVKHLASARVVFLGISRKYRNQRRYAGLAAYLHAKLCAAGKAYGVKWAELSYTLEDNARVNTMIRAMGGTAYRRYRIYESSLTGDEPALGRSNGGRIASALPSSSQATQ